MAAALLLSACGADGLYLDFSILVTIIVFQNSYQEVPTSPDPDFKNPKLLPVDNRTLQHVHACGGVASAK